MNVLIVSYYFPPINSGGSLRPAKMAEDLRRNGHGATVVTHAYGEERVEEPGVVRIHDPAYIRNRNSPMRWLRWAARRLMVEMKNRRGEYASVFEGWRDNVLARREDLKRIAHPSVILATYPPAETLEIGLELSHGFNCPLVADFRDGLLFEPIESRRMSRFASVVGHYRNLEAEVAEQAHGIIAVSEPIGAYFRDRYGKDRVLSVGNGFDSTDYTDLPSDSGLNTRYFNVVHTGRFGLSDRGISPAAFFDAVRTVVEDTDVARRLRVHLAGEWTASERKQIRNLVQKGVVQDHGLVSRERSLAMQRDADLLLIVTQARRTSALSTKLFEYLYARRPILALTHETAVGGIVRDTGSGWVIHPRDETRIVAFLRRAVLDSEWRTDISLEWKDIQPYAWERGMASVRELLNRIVNDI